MGKQNTNFGRRVLSLSVRSFACLICLLAGCKQWPNAAHFQQTQMDNEKLLSEFRAQKKRADDLQLEKERIAQRLDESERMLARLQNSRPSNRISSAEPMPNRVMTPTPSEYSGPQRDPKSLDPTGRSEVGRSSPKNPNDLSTPKWRPSRRN